MSRTIDASVATASQSESVRYVVMARLDFPSGIVAASTGVSTITYNGDDYLGVANFGGVSAITEDAEINPKSITLTLSGIPTELVSIGIGEHYQGRDVRVYLGLLDTDHQLIGNPVMLFRGKMDTMDIQIGDTATIVVSVQSRLADWERARVRRYTHEDQIARYPSDRGFEFVPQMVEKSLYWGRA